MLMIQGAGTPGCRGRVLKIIGSINACSFRKCRAVSTQWILRNAPANCLHCSRFYRPGVTRALGVVRVGTDQHRGQTQHANKFTNQPRGGRAAATGTPCSVWYLRGSPVASNLLCQSRNDRFPKIRHGQRRRCSLAHRPKLQPDSPQAPPGTLVASVRSGSHDLDHSQLDS